MIVKIRVDLDNSVAMATDNSLYHNSQFIFFYVHLTQFISYNKSNYKMFLEITFDCQENYDRPLNLYF